MSNAILTSDIILKEMLFLLENELVMLGLANRDYESEFGGPQKPGATIRIARPIKGQVRTGKTQQVQDTEEGNTAMTVATLVGADLDMDNVDMTLSIKNFGERYLHPQMIVLANTIDVMAHTELYRNCPNWVGTPGQLINSYADYALGPQRLDELSVPRSKDWAGVLSPADYWGTVGSITALSADAPVRSALQKSNLGRFANTDTYMTQNVKSHTVGNKSGSEQVNGANQNVTYATAKSTTYLSQTFLVKGMTNTTGTMVAGDVFTIDNVYAVNAVTGDQLDFLRQFVVITGATASGGGTASITISPAIITSGPYKTCSAVPADSANITIKGTANTAYRQNLVFHPDAITIAMPPLVKPPGAVKVSSQTYKGISARLIEGYDIVNNDSLWRFDVLVGMLAQQPHLATRLSGT